MIRIKDKSKCCGCSACASICPTNAITMEPDIMGFRYPVVNDSICISCGLCEKVCVFDSIYDFNLSFKQPLAYAARHKDMVEVDTSRSGAVFVAMSDVVLECGGVVYGVGYDEKFNIVHKRAVSKIERDDFKGSKYVQSDIRNVFIAVKNDLENGKTVLFSGTPCQTAGLNSYIGKKLCKNLFLMDIVCHGVASPSVWRDYLSFLEKKQGSKICSVNFRDKQKYGWSSHHESFVFEHGNFNTNSFSYLYVKNIIFRKSCGVCPYTNVRRPSDITLADFWGWEKVVPRMNNDNKGISLLLVNTIKGQELFLKASNSMNVVPVDLNDCLQPSLKYPTKMHNKSELFEREYANKGFEFVVKKYGDLGYRYKIKHYLSVLNNHRVNLIKKMGL